MVVCKFFLQGTCRFGGNCRFEHVYPTDKYSDHGDYEHRPRSYNYSSPIRRKPDVDTYSVVTNNQFAALDTRSDMQQHRDFTPQAPVGTQSNQNQREVLKNVFKDVESAESGHQWIFSCFAPLKEGENCPGFDDISPEELRWQAYISTKEGSLSNYTQLLDQMKSDLTRKQKVLKHPTPDVITCLMQLYQRCKVVNPPAALVQSTSNFGSLGTGNNVEIAQIEFSTPASDPRLFGKTTSNNNLFGTQPLTNNNAPSSSLFGGSATNSAMGDSPLPFGSSNAFGKQASAPADTGFSFRVSTQGDTNSKVSATGPSLFGGSSALQAIPAAAQPLFGGSSSTVNTSANNQALLFGGQPAFSGSHPTMSSEQPLFGASHTTPSSSFSQSSGPPPGFFGKTINESSNLFGRNAGSESSRHPSTVLLPTTVYTPLGKLTDTEKGQFLAETFTPGQIPERPPPKELCF